MLTMLMMSNMAKCSNLIMMIRISSCDKFDDDDDEMYNFDDYMVMMIMMGEQYVWLKVVTYTVYLPK